jgi:hypothetical protein
MKEPKCHKSTLIHPEFHKPCTNIQNERKNYRKICLPCWWFSKSSFLKQFCITSNLRHTATPWHQLIQQLTNEATTRFFITTVIDKTQTFWGYILNNIYKTTYNTLVNLAIVATFMHEKLLKYLLMDDVHARTHRGKGSPTGVFNRHET